MNYSLEKISAVEEYDTLLASAKQKKQNLERKRRNLGELITRFDERLSKISTELTSVQIMLQAFTTAYDALPEGKDKINLNVDIKRLELRKARLHKMSFTCNAQLLLQKQVNYNRLSMQVSVIDSYIADLDRKNSCHSDFSASGPRCIGKTHSQQNYYLHQKTSVSFKSARSSECSFTVAGSRSGEIVWTTRLEEKDLLRLLSRELLEGRTGGSAFPSRRGLFPSP